MHLNQVHLIYKKITVKNQIYKSYKQNNAFFVLKREEQGKENNAS